ncbi:IclR family transcriptional regulator [Bacillus sp. X1(2014)]|uniref:IclR family transcriptional regulator n=1 Tax=Bacillus sp. X1(2014) TaxID=1565991 RepID=UPI00119D93B7|nr:IclR family transcriptional regulator [Bacillus sp. X1(2014)]
MDKDPYLLQTLSNGIDVIYAFEDEDQPLSANEIGERIHLNRTTLFRLLYTLRHKGILDLDEETGKYRLGLKLVQLSALVLQRVGIKEIVRPYLEELRDKLNENILLLVLGEQSAIMIDKFEAKETMFATAYVGKVVPLYCTPSGKVFLSFQSEDYLKRYFKNVPLKKFTDNTITDKKELINQLQLTKERGYGFDDEEAEEGLVGFAAPIVDSKGSIIASVSVGGPRSRIFRKKEEILKELLSTTEKISKNLYFNAGVSSKLF